MRTSFIATIVLAMLASPVHATDSFEQQPSLSIEASYTAELWKLAGADSRSRSAYLDNLDLTATLDGETLFGLGGLQLFAYALYNNGDVLNDDSAGVIQGISNIEAVDAMRLYEAWAQWAFAPSASVKVGLYDLNSEFDAIESAGLFINPSHGIGPDFSQSGLNGPSIFPSTAVAVRLQAEVGGWVARLAVLDAVPGDPDHPDNTTIRWSSKEGLLYVAEVDYSMRAGARTGLGYWQYSEAFDDLVRTDSNGEPLAEANNYGAYAFAETAAISLASGMGELMVFTRTGWANEDLNPVSRYVGAGIVWSGFVAGREDQLGISVAQATLGDPWRRAMSNEGTHTRSTETIFELTGRFAIGDILTLQPDVQYVRHPGALADRGSAWMFGLRFELGWSYAR
jgi:porin